MLTYEPKYVSFETAKLLQEKGFEINSSKCYNEDGEPKTVVLTARKLLHKKEIFYPRPELWMIQEWLYEKHNIWIFTKKVDSFFQSYVQTKRGKDNWFSKLHNLPTKSYLEAIVHTLNSLI